MPSSPRRWSAPSGSSKRWRRPTTRRLVLASSFSVYDWSAIRGELTEESPVEPATDLYDRDGYAVAKVWQERVARRMAAEHGWDLTVLRPGFIWGRGNEYLAGLGQKLGSDPPGLRPLDPPAADPRRELRPLLRRGDRRPRGRRRDVQRGRRRRADDLGLPQGLPPRDRQEGAPAADPLRPGDDRASGWPDGRARSCSGARGSCRASWSPAGSRPASSRSGSTTASSARCSAGRRRSTRPTAPPDLRPLPPVQPADLPRSPLEPAAA